MRSFVRFAQLITIGLLSAVALSDAEGAEPIVELVTIGPGRAIDTRFGHNLLRVVDAESGRDDVYDFGVSDLQWPGFIAEVAMGRARFRLQRSSAQIRFDSYALADRQTLDRKLEASQGKFSGQRLLSIRSIDDGDFYTRLGLEESDVLLVVNGEFVTVDHPTLWPAFEAGDKVVLLVMRRGRPHTYEYQIR